MQEQSKQVPELVFVYHSSFPDYLIEDDLREISSSNVDLKIHRVGNGFYNSFEWIVETAFGVWILKPYFDSFLAKAGEEHFELLKNVLLKLVTKGKQYLSHIQVVGAPQSKDKLSKKYNQSAVVSVNFQIKDGRTLKLLFDNNLELAIWNNALVEMLGLVKDNFEKYPFDKLSVEINKLNAKPHKMIYCIINSVTMDIEFKDDEAMMMQFSNRPNT